MIGPGAPKSARRRRVQRLLALERVDAVVALVVGDEGDPAARPPSFSTIGETLPPSASVYCCSSPLLRSSVQMLKMLPFLATSGSSGTAGSVAVDEKTIVWSSTNCAARLVVRAEGELRLLLRVEVEPEQLLVAADARVVDEELAVGRVGRPVVEEIVGREVDDLLRCRDRPCRCRRCRRAAPRTRPCRPSGEKLGDSGSSTDFIGTRDFDLARQHVLDDERAFLLGADEVGEPVALRRPRHPRHRVEPVAELHDVVEPVVLVEPVA